MREREGGREREGERAIPITPSSVRFVSGGHYRDFPLFLSRTNGSDHSDEWEGKGHGEF